VKTVPEGSEVVFCMFEMINLETRAVGGGFLVVGTSLALVPTPLLRRATGR